MPIENLLLKFIFVRKSRGRKKIWNFRRTWEKKIGKIVNFCIYSKVLYSKVYFATLHLLVSDEMSSMSHKNHIQVCPNNFFSPLNYYHFYEKEPHKEKLHY